MAFAAAQVITNVGAAILAKRNVGATPAQAEMKFVAFGSGATTAGGTGRTAAVGDTALTTEVAKTTGTASTVTTTVTNDTYQVVATLTAGSPVTIDEMNVTDVVTAASGNVGVSVTHAAQGLGAGDSIQYTVKIRFVAG